MLDTILNAVIEAFPIAPIPMRQLTPPASKPALERTADGAVLYPEGTPHWRGNTFMKRVACATNECFSCPFARENGSC